MRKTRSQLLQPHNLLFGAHSLLWAGDEYFPFTAPTPAVKAHGCSSACLRLQGEIVKRPQKERVARELEEGRMGFQTPPYLLREQFAKTV